MMRSLYAGVAGLRTHQTKMDVLGNNIANVNTTSFKSQSITFSDLMYQTTQTASGATETKGGVNARQIGLGAKSGAIATAIESQGATQTTNNPFDIMITGKSFFVVNNGKENLYTRDGSFYIDGAGNLAMQSNGYFVQGWAAKEDKETGEIKVDNNGGLSALQIMSADNSTYSPASTTSGLYSGNIDDHDTNVTSDDGKTITLEFYDNKGYLYTGKFVLKDTGYDHLFSLELTDIIDSDGNTINKTVVDEVTGEVSKLLDHVTVGNTKTSALNDFADGYTAEVVNGVWSGYQKAGKEAFKDVPEKGSLINLSTSATGTGKNVFSKVYGKDDGVITGTYGSDATYEVTSAGLKIKYNVTDVKKADGSYNSSRFTANFVNSESYFVKASDGTAYKEPEASGKAGDLSVNILKDVFGISDANATTYTTGTAYNFAYSDKKLEIYDNLTITSGTYNSLTASQKALFTNLESAVTAWGGDTSKLSYTYDATTRKITISEEKNSTSLISADTHFDMPASYPAGCDYDNLKTAAGLVEGSPLFKVDVSVLKNISNGVGQTFNGITIDTAIKAAADDLISRIDSAIQTALGTDIGLLDPTKTQIGVGSLTGTPGIVVYYQYADGTVKEDWATKYNQSAVETKTASGYTLEQPSYVYYNKTNRYDTSYYITDTTNTLDKVSESLLKTVFAGSDIVTFLNTPPSLAKNEYTLTFASNGALEITHSEDDVIGIATDSDNNPKYTPKIADGKVTYVTATNVKLYETDQFTGKISDINETAEGNLAGMLRDIYGLDDEFADAFGSSGTYTIDKTTGKISLTTDDKTIQLLFDPANGALVSANGDMTTAAKNDGLVNIVFDQNIEGLEAFGYQAQPTDDDETVLGRLTLDFSTVTNYNTSGSSTVKAVKGDKKSLNTGRAVGEMNGVNVSTDGRIYATYSNGQTKLLGQIASAEFANASGLAKEGDNLYSATLNSGDPTVQDITTDGGYMNTGVLEMSNVDLSKEFTEMITTQRGFQANSRIITVSDTLLEELTNLKR